MKLSDSDKKLLDSMLEGVEDNKGWENYLAVYDGASIPVTDSNFESLSEELGDSIGSILANAAISIAEQKKLLQSAKTPEALQTAIKLLAVTSGNLMHAGASMLSWMGKKLPQRDSTSLAQQYMAIMSDEK